MKYPEYWDRPDPKITIEYTDDFMHISRGKQRWSFSTKYALTYSEYMTQKYLCREYEAQLTI